MNKSFALSVLLILFAGVAACGKKDPPAPAPIDGSAGLPDGVGQTTDVVIDLTPNTTSDGGTLVATPATSMTKFTAPVSACGLAYQAEGNLIWLLPCSSAKAHAFRPDGTAMGTVDLPGESADDHDLDFAPRALTLGTAAVPAGTLLFTNGETGPAEIYALDVASKMQLGMLATQFGASHVVGGSFHATRGTFFAVQDRQPGSSPPGNLIAEIDAATGAVLNSFLASPRYVINYGDIDVCQPTGNLVVVSSDQNSIGVFDPTGATLTTHALPTGVSGLAGIGINDATGEAWVVGGGSVTLLKGDFCRAP